MISQNWTIRSRSGASALSIDCWRAAPEPGNLPKRLLSRELDRLGGRGVHKIILTESATDKRSSQPRRYVEELAAGAAPTSPGCA